MNIDLQAPIWTIEHVAAALHASVDTAREYTYRTDSPAPKAPFARNLWTREEVLAWFDRLPTRDRRSTKAVTTTTKAASLKPTRTSRTSTTRPTAVPARAGATPAAPAPKRMESYTPRSAR